MSKDSFRFAYDPAAAMRNAPKLLGMELVHRGNQLEGQYYLNGEPHPYRRDKLKVFLGRGGVWISEEGGSTLSLPQYLINYGGAADYKDALRMIKGESQALHWNGEIRAKSTVETKYVPKEVVMAAARYDLTSCALFRWMCAMFPEERVREVWKKYNVTTDSHGNAVYWYTDAKGRVLYDKRIAYKEDGHRNKSFFPGRQYRVGDGYNGKCYFGANCVDPNKKVFVAESEKAAILVTLQYGKQCVATGGKGNLREIDSNMVLLPDMDARREWEERGQVWPWWNKWGLPIEKIPDHADIGDMIEWKKTKH